MPRDIDVCDLVGAYPICASCGDQRVMRDASAIWSLGSRGWVLGPTFDSFVCERCGRCNLNWLVDETFRTKRVRRLNDELRHGQADHASIMVTTGIKAKGEPFLAAVTKAVIDFNTFTEGNDPHGEHDFGSIDVEGEKVFWKIDYFDLKLEGHSLDAANPLLTHRVLTIMLASEY
ncbi:DUF3768 domain-containing protein [Pseudoruegeria sp. HB172150]|uniref:DUF3768 domain-containing protein n=1 Tax=Pseudoruegeria sp. HB172150 TaxID=2721164 RepID=UPI0020A6D812|nr:DUF3768 domain-containing protein [Pseudoruegeria sp. HB172150]